MSSAPVDPVAREVEVLVRARYPILLFECFEESRVEALLVDVARATQKELFCWSVSRGLHPYTANPLALRSSNRGVRDPLGILDELGQRVDPAIFVLEDFHPYLNDATVVRRLRELAQELKQSYKTLVFLSPRFAVPHELSKEVTRIDFPLPDRATLEHLLEETVAEVNDKTSLEIAVEDVPRDELVQASLGLTLSEAENVFARTIVAHQGLGASSVRDVLGEKKRIVRSSGVLEFLEAEEDFERVGGLEELRDWLVKRRLAFTEAARDFGLPYPRGALLVGVQGCGKSLCAKAVSTLWGVPLLRFDLGRVYSSAVGSSEENLRSAIETAESVAPAVLWIDELEKAFAGVQSSAYTDGGTSARIFGSFITWLQEKRSPVFVIATANDVTQLPAELFRKGRFDEIFFVDLPTVVERRAIFRIHLERRSRSAEAIDLGRLAELADGFSGAEIEEAIVSALFDAFDGTGELTGELIAAALERTVPLSSTMREQVGEIRSWAEGRARPAARKSTRLPEAGSTQSLRRIEI